MKKFSEKIGKEGQVHLVPGPALNTAGTPITFSAWASEEPGKLEPAKTKNGTQNSRTIMSHYLTVTAFTLG